MDVDVLRDLYATLDALEPPEGLDRQAAVDRWVLLKQAADRAYFLVKRLGEQILADADGETGFVPTVSSRRVEVRRRFEIELLGAAGEDEFAAWAADNDVDPFVAKIDLSDEAKRAVREAVLDRGDKIPGLSAGYGSPFLAIGRRP